MDRDEAKYSQEILQRIKAPGFVRATLSGVPRWEHSAIKRVIVRPVGVRGGVRLQVSTFDGRKDDTHNYSFEQASAALAEVLKRGYSNVHIDTEMEEVDMRLTKKGELMVGKVARGTGSAGGPGRSEGLAHNRVKEVPLPEGLEGGKADKLLLAMGIVDRAGRVRPTMRAKFTQINEFLKLLEHVLCEATGGRGALAKDREWVVLDCGCGASHLTLATAYYLHEMKGIRARVVGVDLNAEVVEKARARAAESGLQTLEFRTGKIGKLEDVEADIVLALHACDTATDDALAQGIKSGAKLILAVPCCHKELNARLNIGGLAPIQRHGILHERLADGVTDAFRALLLKVMGYRAEVIEFISPEHTARNLMIRAVKVRDAGDVEAAMEYERFRSFVGAEPYLARAIGWPAPAVPARERAVWGEIPLKGAGPYVLPAWLTGSGASIHG